MFAISTAFFLKSLRSAEQLRALYAAGPTDQFESSRLEFIDRQTLLQQTDVSAFGCAAHFLYYQSVYGFSPVVCW